MATNIKWETSESNLKSWCQNTTALQNHTWLWLKLDGWLILPRKFGKLRNMSSYSSGMLSWKSRLWETIAPMISFVQHWFVTQEKRGKEYYRLIQIEKTWKTANYGPIGEYGLSLTQGNWNIVMLMRQLEIWTWLPIEVTEELLLITWMW